MWSCRFEANVWPCTSFWVTTYVYWKITSLHLCLWQFSIIWLVSFCVFSVLPLNWTVGMVGILAGTIEDAFIVLVFFFFLCFLIATWGRFDGDFIDLNMLFSYAAISSKLPSHQNTALVSACLKSSLHVKGKL